MAQKKISELRELQDAVKQNDELIINNDGETKKVKAESLAWKLLERFAQSEPAALHNAVKRGKYLGNKLTVEQAAEIANGTFHDLWLGDYWTINGINYRIGGINYWLYTGDTACTLNHLLIIPDEPLYEAAMNSEGTTEGAYVRSDMYKTNLEEAKTIINAAFGEDHVLSHREYLQNATEADDTADFTVYESGGAWYDSTVNLMNEIMVYGCNIYHNIYSGSTVPNIYTIDKTRIPLFAIAPELITRRTAWWLRDVVSSTSFAKVNNDGPVGYHPASYSFGVRPVFGIIG
jgi:hypothetical protein